MSAFALVAVYEALSGLVGLSAFSTAVRTGAPTIIAYTGDVIVVPGAVAVMIFAVLEIVRPTEIWRRHLVAMALICFVLMILLPISFRVAVNPFLVDLGYIRCPGRVAGYTMPAERFVRDRQNCLALKDIDQAGSSFYPPG